MHLKNFIVKKKIVEEFSFKNMNYSNLIKLFSKIYLKILNVSIFKIYLILIVNDWNIVSNYY